MNCNRYRLVFNSASGTMVAVAEIARGRRKAASGSVTVGAVVAGLLLSGMAQADSPQPSTGGSVPQFVTAGQAAYVANGNQAFVNQVGDKSILNWKSFNISAGNTVQFRQVDSLSSNNLVQGASFTSLNRIWDTNPSVIAGSITQGAGQKANVIMVNTNGVAFMGGSQVNLNSFTASSLDIKDSFILESLFPGDKTPQFEGATGFIKVFEGARISAGNFGKVMLIAPTVVNKGKIEAPDGQVVLAAGNKVYLRTSGNEDANVRGLLVEVDSPAGLADFNTTNPDVKNGQVDGQSVTLVNLSDDKLGHATNLGELSASRGNVTMVGFAVNQKGIARATTSVVANGSVYLQAKDRAITDAGALNPSGAQRGGRVTLGEGSLTEVLPELTDQTGATDGSGGVNLDLASQIQILGQDIRMAGSAVINTPSGVVSMVAVDVPGSLTSANSIFSGNESPISDLARIHIASGARINVAGLENVEVSAARNSVEVELRGDELKDSPVNQQGSLRGEKAYVDVNRALANANSGKSTLIAKDSLESYQARQERTVAERSTKGGSVSIFSQGEVILEAGSTFDLSGGSLQYTPSMLKTTLLSSAGKLTDLADALAETRYDGIATRYVVDYGRWNTEEVIDLGQSLRFDPGYQEGKNAGSLDVFGMKAMFVQSDIQGRTTVGELQKEAGTEPKGARLTLGYDDTSGNRNVADLSVKTRDYKLNQNVELATAASTLPSGFKFGDALANDLKETLVVNSDLLGKDKVAVLDVFSNQAVSVRNALRTPQSGAVSIIGSTVSVNADIEAGSGTINLAARNTVHTVPVTLTGNLPAPRLDIADGVTLSAKGAWINELSAAANGGNAATQLNGGKISLTAEVQASGAELVGQGVVALGQDTRVDASGGARVQASGKIDNGDGGAITISGFNVSGVDQNVTAFGLGKGGKLTLSSNKVNIGGKASDKVDSLNLTPSFFENGGFSDFNVSALDQLVVAEGATIRPTVKTLELLPSYAVKSTGSNLDGFTKVVTKDDRSRQAANITLAAKQKDTGTGEILIGSGAAILADPKAKIALEARNRIEVLGTIASAGGTISALLDRSTGQVEGAVNVNPIWLGKEAVLDVSGKALTYIDSRGLTQGDVLSGGAINLTAKTGYVVALPGSRIDVSGASPVKLDVPNESGGLGRIVGSDAGKLTLFAEEGAILDGNLAAHAGGSINRGGSFDITLSKYVAPDLNTPPQPNTTLSLAQTVVETTNGLMSGSPIPNTDSVRVRLGVDKLESAGFDRIALASRDAISLENGLSLGTNGAQSLREIKLDATRIQTQGGNATLSAETLRVGNYEPSRVGGSSPATNSGTLTLDAKQLELAGKLRLEGMAHAVMNGSESTILTGVTGGSDRPSGELLATADLLFHGAVIAPSTATDFTIISPQHRVEFSRNTDTPAQPFSAQGSLTVEAQDIVQNGNVWAPLGQLEFNATESLTLQNGGLTSVAALSGSVIPFGKVLNGRTWVYDLDSDKVPTGQLKQSELNEKSIRTSGKKVDMQSGAKVDLSGGGDLQAYEFTVGPGGSRDILASANTYAILPGYAGGVAPTDTQEAKGFNRAAGDAVYLAGVQGLPDGVYTLLPAHYALLPGAFAVKLDGSVKNLMAGQSYTRQDGVRIAAGYLTDSRENAPRDANWSGIEVLTHEQVRARSEFTIARASEFFVEAKNRPQDAGLLSIATTGTGNDSLKLDAIYQLRAGLNGRGAEVDVSAVSMAVVSGSPTGIDSGTTQIDVDKLNALGAASLLIGATRTTGSGSTTLSVGTQSLTLANDAQHALKAGEVILAATDQLVLKSGSLIDAQGDTGNAESYVAAGNGAIVRAASTTANFVRSGSPDRSVGTLTAEAGSVVRAAAAITLDATRENLFKGATEFKKNGLDANGSLAIGATRVNLGAAPAGSQGISYSQADLDSMKNLKELTLTSYSTFDIYGNVVVGDLDSSGKPILQNLTLQGDGLTGIDNAGRTAILRAKNLTLSSASSEIVPHVPVGVTGTGNLEIDADTVTVGKGSKVIEGFANVHIAANELVGEGIGKTVVSSPLLIDVARIRGGVNSDQTIAGNGAIIATERSSDRPLATIAELGAKWTLEGDSIDFGTRAVLPSGEFKLTAKSGDVNVKDGAIVDVAGRQVPFFDVSRAAPGGKAVFTSTEGNVVAANGARVNVSGAAGGDAGVLVASAVNGQVALNDGSVEGATIADANGNRGEGARVEVDTRTLNNFSSLNSALNSGGFDGERKVRVRSGDVSVLAGDTVKAKSIQMVIDDGKLDVAGKLDVSGEKAGQIELFAKGDVNVLSGAKLDAVSTNAGANGGNIVIGSKAGRLDLESGSVLNVTGGSDGVGGTVLLRALRTRTGTGTGTGAENDVAISGLNSSIDGARSVDIEAVKVYEGINTLTAAGNSSGTTLSLATVNADNGSNTGTTGFAASHAAIKSRLGKAGDSSVHILSGVEVRSAGDLTLSGSAPSPTTNNNDWNLVTSRAGGEAGVLTLSAAGKLTINSNLSDGFSSSTPCATATCASTPTPATLQAGRSWSYRLIAGADQAAADPLEVKSGENDLVLAAGKMVRTGTGDIRMASGHNIQLMDNKSVVYTAGRSAVAVPGFTAPVNLLRPAFSENGGDVTLMAVGDIAGKPSTQLYSEWLFRQGAVDAISGSYTQQPAWWVRFDQFQQGVGALGGGDVTLRAGGNVIDVSASTPTNGRVAGTRPETSQPVITGGGDIRVEAGNSVLGGQYYVGRGELVVQAGDRVGHSDQSVKVGVSPIDTLVALGDATARVKAHNDVAISNMLNPQLLVQSAKNLVTGFEAGAQVKARKSLFATYGDHSSADLQSLSGSTTLSENSTDIAGAYDGLLNSADGKIDGQFDLAYVLPSSLALTALQGSVSVGTNTRDLMMNPSAKGNLSLLAAKSTELKSVLTLSDRDPLFVPSPVRPAATDATTGQLSLPDLIVDLGSPVAGDHAKTPVHTGDSVPVRVYAVEGDIRGYYNNQEEGSFSALNVSKAAQIRAGGDVRDLSILVQHTDTSDVSRVEAGQDVVFSGVARRDAAKVWIAGPGRLEVTAGRNIDMGTSGGIVSRGDLDNRNLVGAGADLQLSAGVGAQGVDYQGTVNRLLAKLRIDSTDNLVLWQARWLVGNDQLQSTDAVAAVELIQSQNAASQQARVRSMLFSALQTTGRDSNNAQSSFAGDFSRGYAAIETVFPGVADKNPDGSFKNYLGNIDLFASRVKTERGGNIEFLIPGGDLIVGLSNTPKDLVSPDVVGSDVLGIVAASTGDIKGFARSDILVNQSRILTVGGGNVMLWSSEGDIDAGKGKKTATAVPPPITAVDDQGNVSQILQGAVSGSGIGALSSGGAKAGNVDLIAPKGTVNAGDAGIRAGNLNIAAQIVLGADNISVSGTSSGTPVADTSAVTAAASGATSSGNDVSKTIASLSESTAEAARNAEALKDAFKPSFVRVELLGFGE